MYLSESFVKNFKHFPSAEDKCCTKEYTIRKHKQSRKLKDYSYKKFNTVEISEF